MKLQLIRTIDHLTEEQLTQLYQLINEVQQKQAAENPRRTLGALRGGLKYMAQDFDEPLEDFEPYMP